MTSVRPNAMAMSFMARCAALGHPDDDGAGHPVKRRRLRSKTLAAALCQQQVPTLPKAIVHRLWLDLSVIEALGTPVPSKLPDLAMTCLRSWSPQPQVLWTFSEMEEHGIPGLTVKYLSCFMTAATVAFMLAGNVPVQFVKDILSMYIIHQCGGLFLDMDIYWLGRSVQLHGHGYLFPEEPHGRRTGTFMGRAHRYPNLAMFAMPKGANTAIVLAQLWETYWFGHALKVLTEEIAPVDQWSCNHRWMKNTRDLQAHIARNPELEAAYVAPIYYCPLSKTLTMAVYDTLAMREAHEPCLVIDLSQDYVQPSVKTIATHSVFVNLWERQWDPALQAKVIVQCVGIRSQILIRYTEDAMATRVDRAITASMEAVLNFLGKAVGHTVFGFLCAMMECPWLQDILEGGPVHGILLRHMGVQGFAQARAHG